MDTAVLSVAIPTRAELEAARSIAHSCLLAVYNYSAVFLNWKGRLQQGKWNEKRSDKIMREARMERFGTVDKAELAEALKSVKDSYKRDALDEAGFESKVMEMMRHLDTLKGEFDRTYTKPVHDRILATMPSDTKPFTVTGRAAATSHQAAGMALGHFLYIMQSANDKPKIKGLIETATAGILGQHIDYAGCHTGVDLEFGRAINALPGASEALLTGTFTVARLRELTGLGNATLVKYTKQSSVPTAARGRRNHQFTGAQVKRILQTILAKSTQEQTLTACKTALETLN